MVHKFQELDNYDDYDPVPYRGGYDQEAAYGSVKRADAESAYRRVEFGEDEEEQEVAYGNEHNPYGRGPPGRPIIGGHPRPGGVYGGGRDRTRPDPEEAQPDGVDSGYGGAYGRRKPGYEEEESGYGKPSYGGYEEESGYRKPKSSYVEEFADEESQYRQLKYEIRHSSFGKTRMSYGEAERLEEEAGYGGRRKKHDDEEDEGEEEGYGGRRKKKDDEEEEGEEEGYGGRRHKKKDSDEDDSDDGHGGRRHKKKDSDEDDSDEGHGGRRHKKKDSDEGHGGRHHRKKHDDNDESEEEGYRPRRDEEEEPSEKKSWW